MNTAHLTDRTVGTLVGLACGDALGAAYEFGAPIPESTEIGMIGGGPFNWQPGEWTDDTSMAMPIAEEVANGADLRDPETLGRIVGAWQHWAKTASDVGVQTRSVLASLHAPTEAAARAASQSLHERAGRSGGNGSLMRTAPVALAYLHDVTGLTEAATRIAELTHWEPDSSEACVLWCHAIRHAVLTGELNIRIGITELSEDAQQKWLERLDEAESQHPSEFYQTNGWVVSALQAAWSAIFHAHAAGETLEQTLERAVRGGGDTDTVAAIAGSLAGAYFGVSRIPAKWRRVVHGWPGLNYRDLLNLGVVIASGKPKTAFTGWPFTEHMRGTHEDALVAHPHDDGVFMATLTGLDRLPEHVDAVVAMCRMGMNQVPHAEVIEFWLIDTPGDNLDAAFVLTDAANTIAELRAEGHQVVVNCVAAHNRTPAAAVAYSMLHCGMPFEQAWAEVRAVLPNPQINEEFYETLRSLDAK